MIIQDMKELKQGNTGSVIRSELSADAESLGKRLQYRRKLSAESFVSAGKVRKIEPQYRIFRLSPAIVNPCIPEVWINS